MALITVKNKVKNESVPPPLLLFDRGGIFEKGKETNV